MYSSSGFGYVGAELYSAGHALGTEAVSRFGLGDGDKAMVWGLLAQAGRGERTKGVVEGLVAATQLCNGAEARTVTIEVLTDRLDPMEEGASFGGEVALLRAPSEAVGGTAGLRRGHVLVSEAR